MQRNLLHIIYILQVRFLDTVFFKFCDAEEFCDL